MQLTISKVAFWLEKTTVLGWVKLVMLPCAVWFIYYFINSGLIANTLGQVTLALLLVFSCFYAVERLSLWLSKLPGKQCLIAAFDNTELRLALDVQADFPTSTLLGVSFSERAVFNLFRWPGRKHVIRVTTVNGVSELQTNFSYAPLLIFLQQVNATVQKQCVS